jgi:hypothetical protein
VTTISSNILTDKGTLDEGQGAVGITGMLTFQSWLQLLIQAGETIDDLPKSIQLIAFNGGRTITLWDIGDQK